MLIKEIITLNILENLRDWFGKGKSGGAGGGGWDRYNTKGERIGKCGDSDDSEGKPQQQYQLFEFGIAHQIHLNKFHRPLACE